jgi:hypothetical protein
MTKEQYWQAHVKKNPSFADDKKRIEITVGGLRSLMFEAYDKGAEQQRHVFKDIKLPDAGTDLRNFLRDLFKPL